MFAIFVALISLTSVWVGYKIDNSMKRKSEIEDSRINWIQKVREVNTNLIKAFYDFNTHQHFYSEKTKDINTLDNMRSILLEGLEYESRKRDNNAEKYKEEIDNIQEKVKEQTKVLNNKKIDRTSAMYNLFTSIEEMKNLFPINKYDIHKVRIEHKKILVAVESSASFYKGDLSISNEKIYDSLNELKKYIRESYDSNNTLEETKIDEYKDLINNYLKIEWEKVKSRKA
ncbi:hypothetical protein K4U89_10990 [Staphylococcus epidermidis]|nr:MULTISPECIES: hypothetical protein [Staphylococcus]EID37208.1 hypothetical protein ISK_2484 [Staphylococcus epidermidis IS-K]HAR4254463.1 hypothetical protein [Staphylococcus aureus]KAA9318500.1 hypothetical protein F6H98_03110 [Staphylococcus epidermidis]MBM6075834.1 hypothetical protein [Staphylococcus epidermidis]MBS6050223.1 hypothetical protein [Staphylococcus epidermidis]